MTDFLGAPCPGNDYIIDDYKHKRSRFHPSLTVAPEEVCEWARGYGRTPVQPGP